jgi:hypothetical protein
MLLALASENALQVLKYLRKSKSQLRQDLFVLSDLNFKTDGFFVEFGATNGIDLFNTYLFEKEFQWKSILAEPAKCWHGELTKNSVAKIETNRVWKDSHSTLAFNESDFAELSGIKSYIDQTSSSEISRAGKTSGVKAISVNELLVKGSAPKQIDYLSIVTEGSEFEILSNFDFSRTTFKK